MINKIKQVISSVMLISSLVGYSQVTVTKVKKLQITNIVQNDTVSKVLGIDSNNEVVTVDRSLLGGNVPDATTSVKGILQLSGDLGGIATSPTTPTALHKTGNESFTGVKTVTQSGVGQQGGFEFINNTTEPTSYSIKSTNNSGGSDFRQFNSGNGVSSYYENTGSGQSINAINYSTGTSIILDGTTASTGMLFKGRNNGFDTFSLSKLGNVTANSFIKTGGTGSQFLLADGNVSPLKTINGNSIIGTGNITISGGGGGFNPTANHLPVLHSNGTAFNDSNIIQDEDGLVDVTSPNWGSNFRLSGLKNKTTDYSGFTVSGTQIGSIIHKKYGDIYYTGVDTDSIYRTHNNYDVLETTAYAYAGDSPDDLTMDSSGNIYVVNRAPRTISKIDTSGVRTVLATLNSEIGWLAVNTAGEVYVTLPFGVLGQRLAKISTGGTVTYLAGSSTIEYPGRLYADNSGNVFICNRYQGNVIKFDSSGVSSVFGSLVMSGLYDMAMDQDTYTLYPISYGGKKVYKISIAGVTTVAADLSALSTGPEYVEYADGWLYVTANMTQIYKINAKGEYRNVFYNANRDEFKAIDGAIYYATSSGAYWIKPSVKQFLSLDSDSKVELDYFLSFEHQVMNLPYVSIDHINKDVEGHAITTKEWVESKLVGLGGTAPDATTTSKGIVKLAGDFGGTADLPTVPGLSGKQATLVSGTNIRTVNGNSLLGTGDLVISGGSAPYNVYTALVNFTSGTPSVTVLQNTIGTITWSRTGTGQYLATSSGLFTLNKTWGVIQKSSSAVGHTMECNLYPTDTNEISVWHLFDGAYMDGVSTMIEIRVYE